MTDNFFKPEDVIVTYTRAQAIEDGVLVDISHTSEFHEAGFRAPVCISRALWEKIKNVPFPHGDWHGRLWDVCFLAKTSLKSKLSKGEELSLLDFPVKFAEDPDAVLLWIGFNESEGFTLMFPEDY